ncbi:hypothetical protein GCM10017673_42730 [Streptosporangium violaceochromogenes]|nr:hypothetical protein GCM10017673_42730 [Streptosporangium violaceochromogenes]
MGAGIVGAGAAGAAVGSAFSGLRGVPPECEAAEEAYATRDAWGATGPITNAARARALTVTAVRTGLFLNSRVQFAPIVEELPFLCISANDIG